jgi:cellulose synthase/poly-beta-1,6-N-acetylglucosamine synthase-like glycosyltransferase
MKTYLFFSMCAVVLAYLLAQLRRPASRNYASVDVIVPAYNEEPCLEQSLRVLLNNPYVARVICVNDGSTDGTADILAWMAEANPRLVAVNQANTGKGGALMHGLAHVTAPYVFLTDADTYVPSRGQGLGYLIAEIERGADAVGGIPSSNLARAGLLPHIRATVKLPMIVVKRTFQQLLGGAPFIVSGACGMFRAEVLRNVGVTDRTKVEDLDLTWTLVSRGYRVRQASRCIVYPQECSSVREEWRRWRRWIVGYAVCMRLHWRLLFSRFGLFSILPMFVVVLIGIALHAANWLHAVDGGDALQLPLTLFPMLWVLAVGFIGLVSAIHHRRLWLVPLAPLAVVYVLLAYAVWAVHGVAGLVTGREPKRDKPTRHAHVVA